MANFREIMEAIRGYDVPRHFYPAIKKHVDGYITSTDEMSAIYWLCTYLGITMQTAMPYVKDIQSDNRESRLYDDIYMELKKGRKILAIKNYRDHTGVSLKEAKDYVEGIQYGRITRPKEELIIKELPDELWEIE